MSHPDLNVRRRATGRSRDLLVNLAGLFAVMLSVAVLFATGPFAVVLFAEGPNDASVEAQDVPSSDETSNDDLSNDKEAKFEVLTIRGRVVWLAEAMARRHGVKTVPEAATRVLALETAAGDLYPLAEDIRGRGFRRDERLRKIDLELMVRRYWRAPVVQVIRAFELTKEAKLELDYWCDICAIAMFELKPCDCCQGDIELRRRVVDKDGRAGQ